MQAMLSQLVSLAHVPGGQIVTELSYYQKHIFSSQFKLETRKRVRLYTTNIHIVLYLLIAMEILNQIEAYMSTEGMLTEGRKLANYWSLNIVKVILFYYCINFLTIHSLHCGTLSFFVYRSSNGSHCAISTQGQQATLSDT